MTKIGLILGCCFGFGTLLAVQAVLSPTSEMRDRIGPYLGEVPSRNIWQSRYFQVITRINRHNKSPWGSDKRIAHLLANSGTNMSVSDVRWGQLLWSTAGLLGMSAWFLLTQFSTSPLSISQGIILAMVSVLGGGWLRLWRLNQLVLTRVHRLEQQLPALLDLLAFAVSAGEAIVPACQRVSMLVGGPAGDELNELLHKVRHGELFSDALGFLQSNTLSQPLQRVTRALRLALERGTPVAHVLRAQADDARASHARSMLTLAAKKESLMMMPVVFIILPIIVLVALYPGLRALQVF